MAELKAPSLGKAGSVTLDAEAFGARFHEPLVHECVRAELNARRQGTASTLTRGKVRGGGAKPWRQKGTGRARAGSIRSPLWTGGGVTFGPSPRSYGFKVNRKARRVALRSALSLHASRGSLATFDPAGFEAPSTKAATALLAKWEAPGRTLVLVSGDLTPDEGPSLRAALSFRNLAGVTVLGVSAVGVADVIGAGRLLVAEDALERLTRLAVGKTKAQAA